LVGNKKQSEVLNPSKNKKKSNSKKYQRLDIDPHTFKHNLSEFCDTETETSIDFYDT